MREDNEGWKKFQESANKSIENTKKYLQNKAEKEELNEPQSATSKKAIDVEIPSILSEIESHTIVQFGIDSNMKIYMFGGYINNTYSSNRMLTISPKQFSPNKLILEEISVSGTLPGPRHDHCMTSVSKDNNQIYIFGGIISNIDKRSNELWKFDATLNSWTLLTGCIAYE